VGVSLRVEVDEPLVIGQDARVVVVVEADGETHVRGVSLALLGLRWDDEARVTFLREEQALLPDTYLARGTRRLEATVSLAPDLPPTFARGLGVDYHLEARAAVAWWFDAHETRDVRVVVPPSADPRPRPTPRTAVSEVHGVSTLFAELVLDDTTFAPGESVTGSFSVGNVRDEELSGATVTVVGTGTLGGGLDATVFKSLVGAREGASIRFSVPIPPDTAPDFQSRAGDVARELVLAFDGSSVSCRVPIRIGAFAANPDAAPGRTELSAGPRWRAEWREAGAKVGLAPPARRRELRLEGTLAGEVSVDVRARGTGLAAKLTWEDLGIGLSLTPRGLAARGVDLGSVDPEIYERYAVVGRSELQVRDAFEPDLCAAVVAFDHVMLDDHGAEVRADAHARDPRALTRFLSALVTLATAIVRAETRLSPPAWAYDSAIARWRAFAAATGARFRPGRVAIHDATVDGDRFDVDTLVDDRGMPDRTRVTLALDPPLEREASRGLPEEARRALASAVAKRDTDARVSWRPDALALELAGFEEDPAKLREVFAELQRAARRLRGEPDRGPYR
jgi:hypothetical protein